MTCKTKNAHYHTGTFATGNILPVDLGGTVDCDLCNRATVVSRDGVDTSGVVPGVVVRVQNIPMEAAGAQSRCLVDCIAAYRSYLYTVFKMWH